MKTLHGDLAHVFCPAEPTKNCPRDQPQDNSALHSLARATPTETSSAPLSGRAASQARDHLLLWLILTLSSQRVGSFFILAPSLPHLSLLRKAFHQPVAGHALARLRALTGNPSGHRARIPREKAVTKANHD